MKKQPQPQPDEADTIALATLVMARRIAAAAAFRQQADSCAECVLKTCYRCPAAWLLSPYINAN